MDAEQELFAVFRAEVDEQIEDLASLLGRSPSKWRVDRLFQISHNVKGAARIVGATAVRDVAHALEDLFSAVRSGLRLDRETVALARSGAGLLEQSFGALDGGDAPDLEGFRSQVEEAIDVESKPVKGTRRQQRKKSRPEEAGPEADEPEGASDSADTGPRGRESSATVRVGSDKLESIAGLSSELVTQVFEVEACGALADRVTRRLTGVLQADLHLRKNPELREVLALGRELARTLSAHSVSALRLSEEVQTSVRSLRMVPVDAVRTLLSRSLRDACAGASKEAELVLTGGGTEVDRAVLEHLRNPLVHLVRNAVAHGVESPSERKRRGKKAVGRVELRARSAGSWVEIVVADDGAGIDSSAVFEAASAKDLITAENATDLEESEILRLLLLPGMSTSKEITELAGRGVGLDVVASEMRRIGGDVRIATEVGKGSEVVLRVPLTRLTTSGIVVRVDSQTFAFPTSDVERTLRIDRADLKSVGSDQSLLVEGRLVRVLSLASALNLRGELAERPHGVVVDQGGLRRVFLVDEVLGQRNFILQPLPWNLRGAFGFAGSAVLDGGDITLVLDGGDLVGVHVSRTSLDDPQEVSRKRILVVDDSMTSRTLERNILRTAGYEVVTAVDGREALDLLAREKFALVVSDVEMPRVDGFELTRKVRAAEEIDEMPVVLVTSLGSEEDRRKGAEAGADAYIEKGAFDQEELLQTIARLI